MFAYTLSRSYNLAVLLFLLSLLLPWRFVRRLPFEKTATWTLSTPLFVRAFVLFVSSLVFFFGLLHPVAFIPVLFVSGYTQTMYSSIGHVQLYAAYGDNKEFASLVMQLWKKFGMVVAQSTLMIGLLTYGLIVGQTINGGVSFAIPRDWMFGVLLVTWSIDVGLVRLYGWQAKPLTDSHPK